MQWVVDDEDNVLIPTHRRFVLGRSAEILYCFSKVPNSTRAFTFLDVI